MKYGGPMGIAVAFMSIGLFCAFGWLIADCYGLKN